MHGAYGEEVIDAGIASKYINWALIIATLANALMFVILEVIKKRSSRILYGIDSGSYWQVIEMIVLYAPGLFIVTVPPFVIAAFAGIKGNREYVVAKKASGRTIAVDMSDRGLEAGDRELEAGELESEPMTTDIYSLDHKTLVRI